MSKFDYAVLIGRFQPFTKAHEENLKKALEIADKVVVLIGRRFPEERSLKDPFYFYERESIILSSVPHGDRWRVYTSPLNDVPGNDQFWSDAAKNAVRALQICQPGKGVIGSKTCLIGHKKDDSTFYLDLFPEWTLIDTGNPTGINATDVRLNYFASQTNEDWRKSVPQATADFMDRFRKEREWYTTHGLYLWEQAQKASSEEVKP